MNVAECSHYLDTPWPEIERNNMTVFQLWFLHNNRYKYAETKPAMQMSAMVCVEPFIRALQISNMCPCPAARLDV